MIQSTATRSVTRATQRARSTLTGGTTIGSSKLTKGTGYGVRKSHLGRHRHRSGDLKDT